MEQNLPLGYVHRVVRQPIYSPVRCPLWLPWILPLRLHDRGYKAWSDDAFYPRSPRWAQAEDVDAAGLEDLGVLVVRIELGDEGGDAGDRRAVVAVAAVEHDVLGHGVAGIADPAPISPIKTFCCRQACRNGCLKVIWSYFVSDVVNQLDLSAVHAVYGEEERGQPPTDPRLMIKLLVYGYCTGVFSSRRIQKRLQEDIPFRVLAAGNDPDFRTI